MPEEGEDADALGTACAHKMLEGDRVSRGGSWRLSDAAARSAARRAAGSTRGDNDQGLRLAVTAPAPER